MEELARNFSETSSIQQLLRALFCMQADLVRLRIEGQERFLPKEQLIALIERGRGGETAVSLSVGVGLERAFLSHMDPDRLILDLTEGPGHLRRLADLGPVSVPDPSFEASLPLLRLRRGRLEFNEAARSRWGNPQLPLEELCALPLGEEATFVSDEGRHFMIRHFREGCFLIDDVSLDVVTAREIAWWAAVGKALVSRMKENGAVIDTLEPDCQEASWDSSLIPCQWEGRLLGYLTVKEGKEDEEA